MEIERKYLVALLPGDFEENSCRTLQQGYLAVMDNGTEVRVRQDEHKYTLTVKGGGGLRRAEVECALTRAQFEELWPLTAGRRVVKRRCCIHYGEFIIECDRYLEQLDGLITAEVEFETIELSDAFRPPDWFGREITEDPRYKNVNLASGGVPD